MEVVILLVFVSFVLVIGAVVFFAWSVREGTHQHADRLALLPLEDDHGASARPGTPEAGPTSTPDGTDPANGSDGPGR